MKLLLLIVFTSSFFISESATAKKKRKRKRKKSQIAIVQVDGAAVYKVPNFDSPIIAYLNKGRKIRASKKLYPGIGGLGSFYKVRLKKKKYGYVTDVDLFPNKKQSGSLSNDSGGDIFTASGGDDHSGPAMMGGGSSNMISQKRYIGLTYNMVNYSEEVLKTVYTESLTFFGVKLSGPKSLFINLPLELNVMYFSGPPTYYTSLFEKASGFTIIGDILYTIPIMNKNNYMVYIGAGPSVTYSSYLVALKKAGGTKSFELDSQFANVGISGVLGLGYKLGETFALKAEGKYIYEQQGHLVFGGGLQISY